MGFNPAGLATHFTFPKSFLAVGNVNGGRVMVANPQRVAFLISCQVVGLTLKPLAPTAGGNDGIALPNPSFFMFTYSDFGALVSQEWYITNGAPQQVWVQEVWWQE